MLSSLVFSTDNSPAEIAQLAERQTEDLKVPGSNPENLHEFCTIPGLGNFFFQDVKSVQICKDSL